ncbi:hypothetical protein Tsubulata_006503 [Turnera subulata]|uniref:Uncharacterized protein n=1 Tax=Turnera subulata TaxID=218843 RepID=A0A9Q0J247_9ROSI|nr:hypothetical protein Tsubulata_006503 [Turnera subulata]
MTGTTPAPRETARYPNLYTKSYIHINAHNRYTMMPILRINSIPITYPLLFPFIENI